MPWAAAGAWAGWSGPPSRETASGSRSRCPPRASPTPSAEGEPDLFRRGMLRIARATGTAEKAWPAEVLEELGRRAGQPS
ncbi:hypothetical protein [Streptomyces sp. S1]|uniref:hypothetical protein n=1 Tax=Streptomyces sp. S1 TaxID=718288 RepID=UPI003D70B696